MNELPRIEKWILALLAGDTVISSLIENRIFGYKIPQGEQFPVISFALLSSQDVPGVGTVRALTRARYTIKVVARNALTNDAVTLADRIDEIIGKAASETANGFVYSARREQHVSYSEAAGEADSSFRHLGGIYRVDCYKAD